MTTKVYIITTDTHLKIGISNDVNKRLKQISTGSALKPEIHSIYLTKISANEIENRAHKKFKKYRCNGEWFDIECLDAVIKYLEIAAEDTTIGAEDNIPFSEQMSFMFIGTKTGAMAIGCLSDSPSRFRFVSGRFLE